MVIVLGVGHRRFPFLILNLEEPEILFDQVFADVGMPISRRNVTGGVAELILMGQVSLLLQNQLRHNLDIACFAGLEEWSLPELVLSHGMNAPL